MKTMALALACSLPLAADDLVLKSGGRFSGVVEERGEKVLLRTEHATLTFDRAQVASIDRSKGSVLQEYQERMEKADLSKAVDVELLIAWADAKRMGEAGKELRRRLSRLKFDALDPADDAALARFVAWARSNGCGEVAEVALRGALGLRRPGLDPKDAEGHYRLGLWARSNGLGADALILFQETIAAQSDHEHARRALGFQKHQGQWVTEREMKIALGLIEFEGDWVTPGTKEAVVTARALEKERRLLEQERLRFQEEQGRARAEHAVRIAELDARSAEVARREARLSALTAVPPCGRIGPHKH